MLGVLHVHLKTYFRVLDDTGIRLSGGGVQARQRPSIRSLSHPPEQQTVKGSYVMHKP